MGPQMATLGLATKAEHRGSAGVGGASAQCHHSDIHPHLNGPRKLFIMAIHEGR